MNCPNCNNPVSPKQKFCELCGTAIPAEPAVDEQSIASQPPTRVFDKAEPAPEETQRETTLDITQPTAQTAPPYPQENDIEPEPLISYGDLYSQSASKTEQESPQEAADASVQSESYGDSFTQSAAQAAQYQAAPQPMRQAPYPPVQQGGDMPPQKNKTPLIVAVIVAAVLLIGGGIFALLMMKNNDSGKDEKSSTTASSQADSGGLQKDTDSKAGDGSRDDSDSKLGDSSDDDSDVSADQSSYDDGGDDLSGGDSSSYTDDQSSSARVGANHKIVNSDGVVLVEDDAIDADDSEAEAKLQSYIDDNPSVQQTMEASLGDNGECSVYAQGNALVYEVHVSSDLSDTQRAMLTQMASVMKQMLSSSVSQIRTESDVDNAVAVIAYIDNNGELITGTVIEG